LGFGVVMELFSGDGGRRRDHQKMSRKRLNAERGNFSAVQNSAEDNLAGILAPKAHERITK